MEKRARALLFRVLKLQNRMGAIDEIIDWNPVTHFKDKEAVLDSLRSINSSPQAWREWNAMDIDGQESKYFEVELVCSHGNVKSIKTFTLGIDGWEFLLETLDYCPLCDRYMGFGCPFCKPEIQPSIRSYMDPWYCPNCGSKYAKAERRRG